MSNKSKKGRVTRSPKMSFSQKIPSGISDLIGPVPETKEVGKIEAEAKVELGPKTKMKSSELKEEVIVAKKLERISYPIRCREDLVEAFDFLYAKQRLTRRKLKKAELMEEALLLILEKYNDKEVLEIIQDYK
jgi:hypothetical protein